MDIFTSEPTTGVYAITHIGTGKLYIGSAVNFNRRFSLHKHLLNNGKHHSTHLQRAWNKYGENSFSFSVLEVVLNKEELVNVEQQWLDIYESYNSNKGYNICPTAGSPLGVKQSPEWVEKAASSKRGKKQSSDHIAKRVSSNTGKVRPKEAVEKTTYFNSKDWVVVDPNGKEQLIRNLRSFCRKYNLSHSAMVRIAQGIFSHHKGWACHYAPVKKEGVQ